MEGEHPKGCSEQKCNFAALKHLLKVQHKQLLKLSLKLNGMEKILKLCEPLNYNCQISLSKLIALSTQIDWRNLVKESKKRNPSTERIKSIIYNII